MAKNRRSLKWPKCGEFYLTRFDPTVGAEIQKTRPALIVHNDVANRYSPITIVAVITPQGRDPGRPTNIRVDAGEGRLTSSSTILLKQFDPWISGRLLGKPYTRNRAASGSSPDD